MTIPKPPLACKRAFVVPPQACTAVLTRKRPRPRTPAPVSRVRSCEHAARLQIAKLYAATHSAVSTFERAGWLGFDQVQHEGQTLTIFAKRIG